MRPLNEHLEWVRVVLQFPCETCGAPPGKWCLTDSGFPTYTPHAVRSKMAHDHGWELEPGGDGE